MNRKKRVVYRLVKVGSPRPASADVGQPPPASDASSTASTLEEAPRSNAETQTTMPRPAARRLSAGPAPRR